MPKPTQITIKPEDAALVFKANGEINSFLPWDIEDGDSPPHVYDAFLCMMLLSDGHEDIRKMLDERARQMLESQR